MIFILKLQLLKSILIFMVHQLAIKKVFIRKLDDYVLMDQYPGICT